MEYVHFIRPKGEEGPIHVGKSLNPEETLAVLQAGNWDELEIWGLIDARKYPAEWWFDELAPWHIRGGWYDHRIQLLCLIDEALSGKMKPIRKLSPEELDPRLLIPEKIPIKVLADIQDNSPRRRAERKWAWPEVDPYPEVPKESKPNPKTLSVLKRVCLERTPSTTQ